MLKIENLEKSFGKLHVLRGVDLYIHKGEVVAIIGPSGSGKSTFLRCLNLLEEPTGGEIETEDMKLLFGNTPVRETEKRVLRAKTAMVFQNFHLFPHQTTLQNVMEAMMIVQKKSKGEARKTALELLEKVGLAEKKDAYPSQLSGGQQQRVAIARALAVKPDLLLLDEPTSALDPELIGEVLRTIKELAQEQQTMLIVTHEMSFAKEVADRIVFMDEGRVIEEGPAKQVMENPQQSRTKQFLERFQSVHV
ncbi:amino acid ABC transporter ATP-binding protein [Risungbinella massiliensis]|uniref:amino acid ABC transporter ATP-binding protein n=1 Tax=Risungbinella massiliensis TaxID=1329796 RepID=UPI0005CBF0A2|nr:amino acid ABC transporter ATP-binding protein [Risungbinella massiliensis]